MPRPCLHSALVVVVLALQACGVSTPKCGDEETVSLLKKIFQQSVAESVGSKIWDKTSANAVADSVNREIKLNFTTIRTSGHDEKVDKYSCQAVLEAIFPQKIAQAFEVPVIKAALSQDGVQVSGNTAKVDVVYTSQLTDDGKHQLVEMSGHKAMVEAAVTLTTLARTKEETQTADLQTSPPARADSAKGPEPVAAAPTGPTSAPSPVPAPPAPLGGQTDTVAAGPSFDCAKASTPQERLICSTPALAQADLRLAQIYKAALSTAPDKDALRKEQNQWRTTERDVCPDVACILRAYDRRISQLTR